MSTSEQQDSFSLCNSENLHIEGEKVVLSAINIKQSGWNKNKILPSQRPLVSLLCPKAS